MGPYHNQDQQLSNLSPREPVSQYRHNDTSEDDDAHIKQQIMGREVVVAITEGLLISASESRSSKGSLTGAGGSGCS